MIKNLKSIGLFVVLITLMTNQIKSQFIGTEVDSSQTIYEVRKGSICEYNLSSDASPGEEFRWEVTGGEIITPGAIGEGTIDDPSIMEFKADMHTIEVLWQQDDSTSTFRNGYIWVQKQTVNSCASPILEQYIHQWSMPTASINRGYPDFTICSGDTVGGYIVVDLTGAANYTFSYSIKSNGLKDETGNAINTEFHEITTANDTVHIPLPALLENPSVSASKYYTITFTAINDDFLGEGEIVSDQKEFTITVYPSVKIGNINSTKLNRR